MLAPWRPVAPHGLVAAVAKRPGQSAVAGGATSGIHLTRPLESLRVTLPAPCGRTAAYALGVAAVAAASGLRQRRRCGGQGSRRRAQRWRTGLQAAAFDAAAWKSGFREPEDCPDGYYILEGDEVSGLPQDLCGSYFRVSPGRFGADGEYVRHPLDGDGLVLGITFDGEGRVYVRHRLVQTQGLMRDQIANYLAANGVHGTKGRGFAGNLPVPVTVTKNPANAGCVWHEGRLVAVWPYGPPYIIEPYSLGTELGSEDPGSTSLGGILDIGAPAKTFTVTPKREAGTGTLLGFGQVQGLAGSKVFLYEALEGWKARYPVLLPRIVKVPGYAWITDVGFTDRWAVISKPPQSADLLGAGVGKHPAQVVSWDSAGEGELIFATRDRSDDRQVEVKVGSLILETIANAFEEEGNSGSITLDAVSPESWDIGRASEDGDARTPPWEDLIGAATPRSRLVRCEVDLRSSTLKQRVICERHVAYPSVNPKVGCRKNRYIFCGVAHGEDAGPIAGVAKVDAETGAVDAWVPGPTEFGGAPQFVPRGDGAEDDGFLISVIFDGSAGRSDVVILDASDVAKGPICRFPLREAMPHGLGGGTWAEGLSCDEKLLKRKFTLLKMFKKKAQQWNKFDSSVSVSGLNNLFQKQGVKMR